ncbi:MAG: hypothetical protein HOP09_10465 [Hyphomicrobium sp.]|nr:hypothetical protein [Hyphomicrobium sp.]
MSDTSNSISDVLPDPLPMWQTVKQAYAAFFANLGPLLKIALPWLILMGCLSYALSEVLKSWVAGAGEAGGPDVSVMPVVWSWQAIQMALNLVIGISGATMAVAWHRLLLLGEQPKFGGSVFSSAVWRYIGAGIAMSIVSMLPALPMLFFALTFAGSPLPQNAGPFSYFLFFVAYCGVAYLMMHLMLVLPARAVGNNGLNFRTILRQVRANTWRMIGGIFLCSVPLAIPVQMAAFSVIKFPEKGQKIDPVEMMSNLTWLTGLTTPYFMLIAMIYIGFLSFAYRHFFDGKGEPQSAPQI